MNANEILAAAGLKQTKQRISVMELMIKAKAPMTAENIYEAAENISLSTVYRIVEKLCEKGILNKNTIQDSDKFYYELSCNEHRHYAVCLGCGNVKYVDICPVHTPRINDFEVTGHKLEIYGYCRKCGGK